MALSKETFVVYLRNFLFGVEDSLVSTVGLLSGIAVGGMSARSIVSTGIVLIFVEAFSMAVGSFLSEHSVQDYLRKQDTFARSALWAGFIMFFSYFISGFVPILPYMFLPTQAALLTSIALAMVALAILGVMSGRFAKVPVGKTVIRMVFIGGAAVIIGAIVGALVHV